MPSRPKPPTHADILTHKRRLLGHSADYFEAQRIMHGENHMSTINARYDLVCKNADHVEAIWKFLQTKKAKSKDPAIAQRLEQAEKEFEFFTAEREALEKKYRKKK
ncbi:MAG: hypothetical protein AABW59_02475 [archaeon]